MIKSRVDIKNFIVEIENKFPVNSWKIGTIHLWPYLRIKLFFYLVNSVENTVRPHKTIKPKSTFERLKSVFRNFRAVLHYFFWNKALPKKDFLFVGADAHRVDYKDSRFNRYFDILIEKYSLQQKSMYFEYGLNSKKQYHASLIYTFSEPLKGFLYLNQFFKNREVIALEGYNHFLAYLKEDALFLRFTEVYSKNEVEEWAGSKLYPRVVFFKKVLKYINPKKIVILCYYIDDIFPLIIAANQLKIKTIEMQHGPQTNVHLAYSNWCSLPETGYDMIPKHYWCWDEGSQKVIQEWSKKNSNYSVKVIGNPWIDYWKEKEINYEHQNYILYSLQPSPVTIEQLFPKSILNYIKNNPQKWFIRLHPRQLNELDKIKSYLKINGIYDLVNIEEATSLPLPMLLSNASIHVTHFSGTAIESSFFNVLTVLLNEIGVFSFQSIISSQKAVYLNPNDIDFEQKLHTIIQKNNNLPKNTTLISSQENLFEL
jgi:hypothetical protein